MNAKANNEPNDAEDTEQTAGSDPLSQDGTIAGNVDPLADTASDTASGTASDEDA
jgi:hypothetical protein